MDNLTATVRGLTIGSGTTYPFAPQGFPAIWDTADIRAVDVPRPRSSGVIPNDDFRGARSLSFVVRLFGSLATIETAITALGTAFAPAAEEEILLIRFSGTPSEYTLFGRCRGVQVAWRTKALATSVADVRCSFVATDPRRYGAAATQEIGLTTPTLPETMPFVLGQYDSEAINNAGTASVDNWTCEFEAVSGDLVNPSITHVGTGQQILFNNYTVSSGDTLTVDAGARRALLNDTTAVVPSVAQWWSIAPGSNTIRFACGPSSSASSTATVTWRPGWD